MNRGGIDSGGMSINFDGICRRASEIADVANEAMFEL
jgi:hypothetical protein